MSEESSELTIEEGGRIQLFRDRVEDLRNKGLVKEGETRVVVHLVGVVPNVLEGVDADHMAAFLQTLRQFMMNKEPVHFYSMCNLVYRKCGRPELQAWLAYVRGLWKQILEMSPLGISIDGHCYTVDEILELFLYGGMFHSDPEKAEKIRTLPPQIQGVLKMMLLSAIGGLVHVLVVTDKIMWHWLDAPDEAVPVLWDDA